MLVFFRELMLIIFTLEKPRALWYNNKTNSIRGRQGFDGVFEAG